MSEKYQNIATQKELDAAIKAGQRNFAFTVAGNFSICSKTDDRFEVSVEAALKFSVKIVARESSHVVARESSHVVAWGSSHVEAWGSSHVVAWEFSHVEARGFVSLSLWGKATANLAVKCHAFIHGKDVKAEGGIQTCAILKTNDEWCDYYGVSVNENGIATVFKGVRECYGSFYDKDFKWLPGSSPKSELWDDQECSRGLHFSPTPRHTLTHHSEAKKFIACQVKVTDMLVFFDGKFPHKCKAPAVVAPCWEVDINGKPLTAG